MSGWSEERESQRPLPGAPPGQQKAQPLSSGLNKSLGSRPSPQPNCHQETRKSAWHLLHLPVNDPFVALQAPANDS